MAAPDLASEALDTVLRQMADLRRKFYGDIVGVDKVRCAELSADFDKAMKPLLETEARLRGTVKEKRDK
jgi:hypothetical protein